MIALGGGAREAIFTGGGLDTFRWLHLATHARIDDRHPELSALELAGGGGEDGRLRLYEIAGLELGAELVTLAACRSGLGEEVRGEGLVGLRGAFLEAGARRVLTSLWDVSDDATAELMRQFYRFLWRDGLEPEEALRRAQANCLATSNRQAPFYWAAFVLSG